MNISAAGAPPPAMPRQLVSQLASNGLTAEKASLVATEATAAFQSAGNMSAGPAQKETVKAALEKRISADVASGKLSAEDAKAVYKTFEELDPAKQNGGQGPVGAGGPPPGGRPGGPPPGGGAGGPPPGGGAQGPSGSGQDSSSTNKTTVSETTTIIGEIEFTIVVYSDGTTETTQQNVGGTKDNNAGTKAQNNSSTQSNKDTEVLNMFKQYLASLEPGSLVDRTA